MYSQETNFQYISWDLETNYTSVSRASYYRTTRCAKYNDYRSDNEVDGEHPMFDY